MKNEITVQAETYLRKSKNKELPFVDIWNAVVPKNIKGTESERLMMAEVHADMLQDPNFINVGENKWKLREFVNFEDFKRNKSSMFGIDAVKENYKPKDKGEVEFLQDNILDELNAEILDDDSN